MKRFALTLLLCLLGLCATAVAKSTSSGAPPGNSGVNQYIETVPTDHGNKTSRSVVSGGGHHHHHPHGGGGGTTAGGGSAGGGGTGSTGASSAAVSPSTRRTLTANGIDGVAAAALAQGTAPSVAHPHNASGSTNRTGSTQPGPAGQGTASDRNAGSESSALGSVVSALTGSATSGGLSELLPVILAAVFLGMAGFAIVRSRRTN